MITVDITPFSSGSHHVELDPESGAAGLDPAVFSDLHVEADLQVHRDRILAHLTVEGTAELTCDRTLRRYDQPLEGQYSVLFGPASMVGQEGDAFDEVRALDPTDREIEITDVVRETLLLAIPQRTIAPGAEEEEIDTSFGEPEETDEDEPIDPRWNKLKQLKEDDE